jgi:uncharacterized protein YPO0396
MWSLFETNNNEIGYRLKALEVFNWGTFHEGESKADIWRIQPDGQNSLLTGANGSGKTTLVDALLAILVNPSKRFFNQSSGAIGRKERDEASYVEGHYGHSQNSEQLSARVEKLRPNRSDLYSVVLAVFINKYSTPITLIQIRWFTSSGLQRKYILAKKELNIIEHIQFSTDGTWLRKLKKQFPESIEDFDSFPKYANTFQRAFGMKSEKALSLFNQTVGMKVLGDLDAFIRTNMLEESSAENDFVKLMDHYQTLLVSYKALEKARIQLELLQPIYLLNEKYLEINAFIRDQQKLEELLEPWFAKQKISLWKTEMTLQDRELDKQTNQLVKIESDLEAIKDKIYATRSALDKNELNQKIKELEREKTSLEKSKIKKENASKDYNRLARKLGLIENPDAVLFEQNAKTTIQNKELLVIKRKDFEKERINAEVKVRELVTEFENKKIEIQQLESSSGKITGRVVEIQSEILEVVGASKKEIPFAAELMQVKASEKDIWNRALEKLLHSFGLSLLVPEKYYSAVNQYLNQKKDLRGKIKYMKVGKVAPNIFRENDEQAVVHKLEFNTSSQYVEWIIDKVSTRFNYNCMEDQTIFERSEKAILPSGLIRNKENHERDDNQPNRQILGWDNKELLSELKRVAYRLNEEISTLRKSIVKIETEQKEIDEKFEIYAVFVQLKYFSEIDWQQDVIELGGIQKQINQLQSQSDTLKSLKEQLEKDLANEKLINGQKEQIGFEIRQIENNLVFLKNEILESERFLDSLETERFEKNIEKFDDFLKEIILKINFSGYEKLKNETIVGLQNAIKLKASERETLEKRIRQAMGDYKTPPKSIKEKFDDWDHDNFNLKTEIDQLQEYIDKYNQIKTENIVELEKRFQEEFKSGVTKALSDYVNSLELQHERIESAIDEINYSLKKITFNQNPNTYIQIERTDTRRPMIRDFRFDQMNSWQPDKTRMALMPDPKEAEMQHFIDNIKPFVDKLNNDDKWRKEVTDVRNWSDFRAREYFMEDDVSFKVYENSGGLSGGESAQLAYTVLGASLAHQFGISRDKNSGRSFRLIVVDEAFSKLDEDKSKYLLQLCHGLGLQLIAVTPLTSIHLVENDVSVIHWVTKSSKDKRKSTVRDIPIFEYKLKKEALLEEVEQ